MNKTQARTMIRRCREALREIESLVAQAEPDPDPDALTDWIDEANGAVVSLYEYAETEG